MTRCLVLVSFVLTLGATTSAVAQTPERAPSPADADETEPATSSDDDTDVEVDIAPSLGWDIGLSVSLSDALFDSDGAFPSVTPGFGSDPSAAIGPAAGSRGHSNLDLIPMPNFDGDGFARLWCVMESQAPTSEAPLQIDR